MLPNFSLANATKHVEVFNSGILTDVTFNEGDAMMLDVGALIEYAGSDSCEEFSGADLKNLLNQSLMSGMRSQVQALKS